MKSNLSNEIKAYIVRQGMTMQEVVDLLHDEHGGATAYPTCPTSSSGIPALHGGRSACQRAEHYEIVWQKKKVRKPTNFDSRTAGRKERV